MRDRASDDAFRGARRQICARDGEIGKFFVFIRQGRILGRPVQSVPRQSHRRVAPIRLAHRAILTMRAWRSRKRAQRQKLVARIANVQEPLRRPGLDQDQRLRSRAPQIADGGPALRRRDLVQRIGGDDRVVLRKSKGVHPARQPAALRERVDTAGRAQRLGRLTPSSIQIGTGDAAKPRPHRPRRQAACAWAATRVQHAVEIPSARRRDVVQGPYNGGISRRQPRRQICPLSSFVQQHGMAGLAAIRRAQRARSFGGVCGGQHFGDGRPDGGHDLNETHVPSVTRR